MCCSLHVFSLGGPDSFQNTTETCCVFHEEKQLTFFFGHHQFGPPKLQEGDFVINPSWINSPVKGMTFLHMFDIMSFVLSLYQPQ